MADRIRLLVVDDDAEVRSLLERVLGKGGYQPTQASNGAQAMELLGREEFDVALVDIKLPDASGLDILRWARDTDTDTEFIVLTGNADVETASVIVERLRERLAATCVAYAGSKPIVVTASFGMAPLDSGVTLEESINRADQALLAAKSAGRNRLNVWQSPMPPAR